jgi:hypothetical protein
MLRRGKVILMIASRKKSEEEEENRLLREALSRARFLLLV